MIRFRRLRYRSLVTGGIITACLGSATSASAQPSEGEQTARRLQLGCVDSVGKVLPPLPRVVPMTGISMHYPLVATVEYGAMVSLTYQTNVFAQGMLAVAGRGASLGVHHGERNCMLVRFLGAYPMIGRSMRVGMIRTHGEPKGKRYVSGSTLVGVDVRLHMLFAVGIGAYKRVAGPGAAEMWTAAIGLGF